MTETPIVGPVPPYVSFQTLMNQVERMEKEGIPGRIDATYLTGMSGGTQNQLRSAMRTLGFLGGDDDRPTPALIKFVKDKPGRPQQLADMLTMLFPALVSLEMNATSGQLDDELAKYELSKETRRKAATFYLAAAAYAKIPVSPMLKPLKSATRKSSASSTRSGPRNGQPLVPPHAGTVNSIGSGMVGSATLRSGGTVTISVAANLFDLSDADQEFVNGLVKTLRKYKGTETPSQSPDSEDDAATQEVEVSTS